MNDPWPDPDNPIVAILADAGAPAWLRIVAYLAAHIALGIALGLAIAGMLALLRIVLLAAN